MDTVVGKQGKRTKVYYAHHYSSWEMGTDVTTIGFDETSSNRGHNYTRNLLASLVISLLIFFIP